MPLQTTTGLLTLCFTAMANVTFLGCGKGPTAAPTTAQTMSATELFSEMQKMSPKQRSSLIESTAKLSVTNYYQVILQSASSLNAAEASDQNLAQLTSLKSQADVYSSLDQTYATVGDYWRATGYDAASIFTEAGFRAALDQSSKGSADPTNLALTGDTATPSTLAL